MHKAYFDSIDRGPVRYIVLTQGHVDHVGGVELFREPGTEVVAHANNAAQQAYDARLAAVPGAAQLLRLRRELRAHAARGRGRRAAACSRGRRRRSRSTDRYAFELGGVRFELIGCDGAETEDSLLVWLPQHRICFTGNVFGALFGHFPNLVTIRGDRYRDALTLRRDARPAARARRRDAAASATSIRWSGRDLIRSELARMRGAVLYVHDAVVAAMNAGERRLDRDARDRAAAGARGGRRATARSPGRRARSGRPYQGWFHGRSTTRAVRGAAVERVAGAGGARRRPRPRGRRPRAQGRRPRRSRRCTWPRRRSPPIPRIAARSHASLAAHRALLARSVNFWETRWLEREIRKLETNARRRARDAARRHPHRRPRAARADAARKRRRWRTRRRSPCRSATTTMLAAARAADGPLRLRRRRLPRAPARAAASRSTRTRDLNALGRLGVFANLRALPAPTACASRICCGATPRSSRCRSSARSSSPACRARARRIC